MIAEEKEQQQVITYVQGGEYKREITHEKLDKDKVEGGRKGEMKFLERMGVFRESAIHAGC